MARWLILDLNIRIRKSCDWRSRMEYPNDPDAKITKMKDGRAHLAHKAEYVVDLETGAIVAVTLQPANRGDTTSIAETIEQADESLVGVMADETACKQLNESVLSEVVVDKGYHSNAVLKEHCESDIRSYIL